MEQWKGFTTNVWQKEVNVRDFILSNFEPYQGDEAFLEPPTEATSALRDHVMDLTKSFKTHRHVIPLLWFPS